MLKKISFIQAFLIMLCFQQSARAAQPVSLGVVLGAPTGFTGKYWTNGQTAVDGGLAFSFDDFLLLYGDHLWHFPNAFNQKGSPRFPRQLSPYVGLGGVLFVSTSGARAESRYFTSSGSSVGLGLRIPLGMEWRPVEPRIGVFAEIVPGVGLIPSTFGFLQAGLGARFYF